MSVAGNSFEETIAMVTAGTEIMVGQPAKVGRGLRTIAINISKLAQEEETLSVANGKYTISLQDQNGQMRSTYDIMSQLGDIWGDLNETEQTALATQLAGKTQFEVFSNVMKNWGTAVKATNTALDSNGSSIRENEKYLDSIEGKIQAFRSAWEQLSFHLVNSDLIKDVVDLGTKIITVIDNIVQKIGALPTVLGALGVAFGAMKLGKLTSDFLGVTNAMTTAAEATNAMTTAAGAAGGAKGIGGLSKALGVLTSPAVIGGIVALGVALGSIALKKYFSLGNSIERLNDYQDKLKEVTTEIEQLNKKRGTDEGLTRAESIHLNVLLAEERSLERQVELEKQRVQNAFKKDINTSRKGETGLPQISAYQSARTAELNIYKQMEEKQQMIDDARLKLGYAYATNNQKDIERYKNVLEVFDKELTKLDSQRVKFSSEVADTSAELLSYWEQVVSSVDYSKLTSEEQNAFNDLHKNVITSQLDIGNLKSDYNDFATIINSTIDSLGVDSIDIFSGVDFSKITTIDDLITTIKENLKSLDGDKEITFSVRDKDGNIEERVKKISELTDEDIEAIIRFTPEGIEEVESEADEASQTRDSIVQVAQEGAQAVSGVIDDAAKNRDSNVDVSQTGASTVNSDINNAAKNRDSNVDVSQTGASTVNSDINNAARNRTTVISVIASGISAVKSALSGIGHASGKRKGEEGGLAWLGDEGSSKKPKPELVVSEDGTAYLAGTTGWELHNLKDSDTVYSYSETKKLLGGRQSFIGSVDKLPRYKKGKKKNTAKWEKEFDEKLETLQHKAKANHWTDAEYQAEYKKLYDSYVNKATTAQLRSYIEDREDYENQVATDSFKRRIGNIGMGYGNLADLVSDINANADLSADEKIDAIADAYKASVEYNLKEYENGKNTRDKVVQDIKNYYATRGEYDEDYYKMLDDLREADQKKEVKRLKELSKQQENKLSLAQKYLNKELDSIEKQIDAQKEEAEAQEKLIELQNDLNKAKSTSIRIYKEGVGFVYEQDTEAIKEAQKALDEYTSSQTKSELEQRADAIKEVLQLFEDLQDASDIHELELTLGVSSLSGLTGGNLGTNLSKWSDWIKGVIVSQIAYSDLNEQIGNLSGADIDKWLGDVLSGGSHQISNTTLSEYLSKHSFANGTLSAPGGLSRVGENLNGELVWLGKGDSVYSNGISKNLMQWGRYNPAQVLSSNNHSSQQVFNFDKIVLPNVRNAEDFYRELQKLPNMAIQQSTRR